MTNHTSASPRLWLIRHAQPLVQAGVCYGQLSLKADQLHTQQSAKALVAALPQDWAELRCSPLERCVQLRDALLRFRDPDAITAHLDERLQEMDFGAWEGQRWDAIAPDALAAWTDDFPHYRPGQGESLAAMLARVSQALEQSCAIGRGAHKDVVWITHAGVIRCVHWLRTHGPDRMPTANEWTAPAPGYGDWITLAL